MMMLNLQEMSTVWMMIYLEHAQNIHDLEF